MTTGNFYRILWKKMEKVRTRGNGEVICISSSRLMGPGHPEDGVEIGDRDRVVSGILFPDAFFSGV